MVGINFYLANPGICRALLEENVFIFRLGLSTLLTNSKKKKNTLFSPSISEECLFEDIATVGFPEEKTHLWKLLQS